MRRTNMFEYKTEDQNAATTSEITTTATVTSSYGGHEFAANECIRTIDVGRIVAWQLGPEYLRFSFITATTFAACIWYGCETRSVNSAS